MKTDFLLSNIYIIIFILFWITKIVLYQKKKKIFDAGSLLLFFYLFYSTMSLILFNITEDEYNSIKLFPFIYLFSMLMLVFYPILKYDYVTTKIQKPSNFILNLVSIIFIIFSILQIPEIISNFQESIIKLLVDSEGGLDMYNEAMAESTSLGNGVISNLPSIITNSYGNFGILLLFYYLTLNNRNKIILIGLFISCTIGILINISLGQRGPIVETLLVMIISYFTFRKIYQSRVNNLIRRIGIALLALVAIPIIALTQSRFSDFQGGSNSSVIYYVGQENLNFNNYALDNGGLRYGDRTFTIYKKMLGFEKVPNNFWERRFKYPNLKINDEVFIGFVGDFTLDFGPFITPFIFIFFIIFILKKTIVRNNVIYFHQLILLHFLMSICMIGGMKLYPFSFFVGNLQLIVYFIAYFLFKFSHLNNNVKNKPVSFS